MLIAPVVVVVGLVLSAEQLEVAQAADGPARGSVDGPWAFVDLGLISSGSTSAGLSQPPTVLGSDVELVGGFGFHIGDVRFSPTARFSFGPRVSVQNPPQVTMAWSSLAFALAAPDLINDSKFTGLRFTPIIAATFPTHPQAYVGGQVPITVIRAAGQLERRFGSLELAYRGTGSTTRCQPIPQVPSVPFRFPCTSTWDFANRLFAENWFTRNLSAALGLGWSLQWLDISGTFSPCPNTVDCDLINGKKPTHSIAATTSVSWAFSELFGGTLEVQFSHTFGTGFLTGPSSSLGGSISVWFRTDAQLQRNWLDR